ncbi:MAG TPA: hypothetical protein PL045_06200 [Chitinophagaceae bacterium]|nr:hypothetical protein [Chitinophagaceae bacterium]
MKGRYINTKILLACLSVKPQAIKDIHEQLKETIAEHKRIMRRFNALSFVKAINEFENPERKAA